MSKGIDFCENSCYDKDKLIFLIITIYKDQI